MDTDDGRCDSMGFRLLQSRCLMMLLPSALRLFLLCAKTSSRCTGLQVKPRPYVSRSFQKYARTATNKAAATGLQTFETWCGCLMQSIHMSNIPAEKVLAFLGCIQHLSIQQDHANMYALDVDSHVTGSERGVGCPTAWVMPPLGTLGFP